MKRLFKGTLWTLGSLLALVVVGLGAVYVASSTRLAASFEVPPSTFTAVSDSALVARGEHIAAIRGCGDCHGENFGGRVFIDEPPLGRIVSANLTSGGSGAAARFTDADWDRAIRHGVRPDGTGLLVMPSQEYHALSDEDLAALVAYFRSLPPVDSELPTSYVGPLGRALYLAGKIPLLPAELVKHDATRAEAPPEGPTAAYGAYLATSCTGCHGADYSGGVIPGSPPGTPPAADITAGNPNRGIGAWTEAQFFTALREGKRPDGRTLNDFMPWRATARMTDDEIRALYLFLRTQQGVPALAHR